MKTVDASRLVFLDESAANTRMSRSHAWIRRGEELVEPRSMNWGKSLTMIGAIRLEGFICLGTLWGAANYSTFHHWFSKNLLPKLKWGDIVILDNAKIHKDPRLKVEAKKFGVRLKYLPAYSPDFNPIEPAWALVKKFLKKVAAKTPESLRRVAHIARRRVTASHCRAWIKYSGYRVQLK